MRFTSERETRSRLILKARFTKELVLEQ